MTYYDLQKEWERYGEWLVDRANFHKANYDDLMILLHQTSFYSCILRDADRAKDGKYLREDYFQNDDLLNEISKKYEFCSVLEMLVAFAIRIDNEWIGDPGEEHPETIFWEMLCNLGLDKCTNRRINIRFVMDTLDIWLGRRFDPDGEGSIFPLKNPSRDQREVEIWGQLQEYLGENY
jgi:hypothetical protein